MNWLSTNHIQLDYHKKTIWFPIEKHTLAILAETTNLLVTQIEKCMDSKTLGNILLYSVEAESKPRIEEISMVKEYLEMFSLEVENLPFEWEVNFSINLLLSTEPICWIG